MRCRGCWSGTGRQRSGSAASKQTILTGDAHAFRGTLGTKIHICDPGDPEAKGLVERSNGYYETSFLPGRTFSSPADFNTQLAAWLPIANARTKRALGCAPAERVDADRAAMIALPPVAPVTGWRFSLRLPRDHYVRVDSNDYSVHPGVVGRRVDVEADLQTVRVCCEGRPVAEHARSWAWHQTITDPVHHAAATALRVHRSQVMAARPVDAEVELRALTDYDTALGLDDEVA